MKKILIPVFVFVFLLLAFALGSFLYLKAEISPRHTQENAVSLHLKVTEGMNARKIGNLLYSSDIIKNPKVFYLCARYPAIASILSGKPSSVFKVKAGLCTLESSLSVPEIYERLSNVQDENLKLTIPEGLTASKIAALFEEAGLCGKEEFLAAVKDPEILKRHHIIDASAEGYLFPDTYEFHEGEDASRYVEKLIETFEVRTKDIPGIGLSDSPSEEELKERSSLVVLASIIEREYRVQSEAPVISSVFHNRLDNGIGLYSCATVEYVITEILGRPHPDIITYDDLKIESPYNTYRNAGLPPGAISNPGLTSLRASAEPEKTDYFYFRLIDAEEGRHVFTKTLQEHVDEGVIFNTKKAAGR